VYNVDLYSAYKEHNRPTSLHWLSP